MVSAAGIIGHSIDVEVEKELLATDTSTSDESTNKEGGGKTVNYPTET